MKLLELYLVGKVDGSKVGEADLWPVMGMVEQIGMGRTVSMRLTVEEIEESVPLTIEQRIASLEPPIAAPVS